MWLEHFKVEEIKASGCTNEEKKPLSVMGCEVKDPDAGVKH